MQLVSPVQLFDTSVKSTVASRRLCYIYICIILLIIIQALMTVCGDLNIKLSDILIERLMCRLHVKYRGSAQESCSSRNSFKQQEKIKFSYSMSACSHSSLQTLIRLTSVSYMRTETVKKLTLSDIQPNTKALVLDTALSWAAWHSRDHHSICL